MLEAFEVSRSPERRGEKVWICENSFLPAFSFLTMYWVILFRLFNFTQAYEFHNLHSMNSINVVMFLLKNFRFQMTESS